MRAAFQWHYDKGLANRVVADIRHRTLMAAWDEMFMNIVTMPSPLTAYVLRTPRASNRHLTGGKK